jgi:hypothetical protein
MPEYFREHKGSENKSNNPIGGVEGPADEIPPSPPALKNFGPLLWEFFFYYAYCQSWVVSPRVFHPHHKKRGIHFCFGRKKLPKSIFFPDPKFFWKIKFF